MRHRLVDCVLLRLGSQRRPWLLTLGIVVIALWSRPAAGYNADQYARIRLGMTGDEVIHIMGARRRTFDDVFGMTGRGSWRTIACDPMTDGSLNQWWYCFIPRGPGPQPPRAGRPPDVDYWIDGSIVIGVVYSQGKVSQKVMNVRIPSWEKKLRQWLDGI